MILKKYSPKGQSCRVTFEVPAEWADVAISVVGDFNDWDYNAHPMKHVKRSNVWRVQISLKPDSEIRFRYLSDKGWFNDPDADGKEGENSVVSL
jgi:1,4-alpha-glucan branching enzyme